MNSARPKLSDVARHAGVSVSTVSRVLNDRGYLSADVRARVATAVAELGYRPNEVARSLLGRGSRVVGLIVPTVADPFFGELAARIEGVLDDEGYKMLLCDSHNNAEREAGYLDLLIGQQVEGIITSTHNEGLGIYAQAGLPIVALDRAIGTDVPNVRSDNAAGGELATRALIAAGYERIMHVSSSARADDGRHTGYRDAIEGAGLAPHVFAFGFASSLEQRRTAIHAELDRVRPDGVFASDDVSALMVLDWAHARGVAVPDELGVVGYDGAQLLRYIAPHLATVRQPIADLAAAAVATLRERIAGDTTADAEAPAREIVLPVEFFPGSTIRGRITPG